MKNKEENNEIALYMKKELFEAKLQNNMVKDRLERLKNKLVIDNRKVSILEIEKLNLGEDLQELLIYYLESVHKLTINYDYPIIVEEDYDNKDITIQIKCYLEELKKIPLLSAEEEQILARKCYEGDKDAKEKLILANLRLVASIARRFPNKGMTYLDQIQEGNIGLMRAIDKFDPNKGFKLSTYATWWIKQSIFRASAEQARNIRIPIPTFELLSKMKRYRYKYTEEYGIAPTKEELALYMNISLSKVEELLYYDNDTVSLETPIGEDEDCTLKDCIALDEISVYENYEEHYELKELLLNALDTLKEKEKRILELRYGFTGEPPKTLEEIGKIYGVTRERIRQVEQKALLKLRRTKKINNLSGYDY